MLDVSQSQDMFRQSYIRGLGIFFYGVAWLIALLASYPLIDSIFPPASSLAIALGITISSSTLAGGLGGATAMLSRLYQHLSIKQDFQEQSIFSYLIQPIIGLILGIIVLIFIAIPAALLVNYAVYRQVLLAEVLVSPTFIAIQILLGWIAGFYQQRGLDKVKSFTQRNRKEKSVEISSPVIGLDEDAPLFYKAWFHHQQQMIRWSYTWGVFLLLYGILWLIGLLAGYLMTGGLFTGLQGSSRTVAAGLVLAAWPIAAAGGLGGVCSLWYDLYWHVSIKQDFHRQHIMSYLVRPIIGFVFGLVMYLLLASGYLSVFSEDGEPKVVDSSKIIMVQLLLGWIAGFRQQSIADLTQGMIQRIVSLFKLIGRLINPFVLFNTAKREALLEEIGMRTEIFQVVDWDESTSENRKWWQFD